MIIKKEGVHAVFNYVRTVLGSAKVNVSVTKRGLSFDIPTNPYGEDGSDLIKDFIKLILIHIMIKITNVQGHVDEWWGGGGRCSRRGGYRHRRRRGGRSRIG